MAWGSWTYASRDSDRWKWAGLGISIGADCGCCWLRVRWRRCWLQEVRRRAFSRPLLHRDHSRQRDHPASTSPIRPLALQRYQYVQRGGHCVINTGTVNATATGITDQQQRNDSSARSPMLARSPVFPRKRNSGGNGATVVGGILNSGTIYQTVNSDRYYRHQRFDIRGRHQQQCHNRAWGAMAFSSVHDGLCLGGPVSTFSGGMTAIFGGTSAFMSELSQFGSSSLSRVLAVREISAGFGDRGSAVQPLSAIPAVAVPFRQGCTGIRGQRTCQSVHRQHRQYGRNYGGVGYCGRLRLRGFDLCRQHL